MTISQKILGFSKAYLRVAGTGAAGGFAIGAGIGAVLGAAYGLENPSKPRKKDFVHETIVYGKSMTEGMIVGAAVGGAIGATLGGILVTGPICLAAEPAEELIEGLTKKITKNRPKQ